ncbi:low affinity immunoglobulin epsilon Fc receptor isoform X6 [Camelus bactrianus]|uniref:low affinity immunoglobulin epsilon Fc receptor isoform X6 n=1 Tax=Camelus bactrianus TaxID=9837 RepID=UPI003D6FAC97
MTPHGQAEGRGPGPALRHQADFSKFTRRRRCCRKGIQLALVGLVTAALWAGLLTLLLLWHWDTLRNLKQLEENAARNVTQVSKDLERHKGDEMAQKSQAAQMLQNMERIQAEQKRMESQEFELFQNLDGLRADLSNLKSLSEPWEGQREGGGPGRSACSCASQSKSTLSLLPAPPTNNPTTQDMNERRMALESLERLQEEIQKLWVELRESNGSTCNTCPEKWVSFQRKCYYFGEGAKKWIQARFACSNLHGRLVSIHSQEEQDFLTKHANKRGSWIGLRDLDIEGEFIWMDKKPLNYSNWQPGEPNDAGQGENCVMMQASGQWNDAFCNNRLDGWVCDRLATC